MLLAFFVDNDRLYDMYIDILAICQLYSFLSMISYLFVFMVAPQYNIMVCSALLCLHPVFVMQFVWSLTQIVLVLREHQLAVVQNTVHVTHRVISVHVTLVMQHMRASVSLYQVNYLYIYINSKLSALVKKGDKSWHEN